MRLLVISNGHGEDAIAAEIIRRLPRGADIAAYPTVGSGHAYAGVCPIVGPRRFLPSEGVRRRGSLLRDLRVGFGIGPALRFMRREARGYDAILVVGDLLGVVMCWWTGNRVTLYLDVYKSGFGNRYSGLETAIIKRSCARVLTRDDVLAGQLRQAGIDARFAGNVMMDTLARGPYDAAARRRHARAIAILPGSRASAADNFALQAEALRRVPESRDSDIFVGLAPDIEPTELARAAGLAFQPGSGAAGDVGQLVGDGLCLNLVSGSLGNVLEASDVVLGQAGTANLQALGLGRPVISFLAGDVRAARVARVAALAGESRIVVPEASPEALAAPLGRLLRDDAERSRRGAIGRDRIGPPGAIAAIAEALFAEPVRGGPSS